MGVFCRDELGILSEKLFINSNGTMRVVSAIVVPKIFAVICLGLDS